MILIKVWIIILIIIIENENNIEDRELNGNDIDPIGYHFDNNYLFDSFRRNRDRLRDRNLINNNRREIINNSLDDDEDEEEGDNVVGNSYNSLDDEFLDDYNDGLWWRYYSNLSNF